MINLYKESELDELMAIWLETNIETHLFVSKSYWKENYELVKTMLPTANIYTYKLNGIIVGFIGVMDSGYIAGLFIKKEYQSNGIGQELIDYCKEIYLTLSLNVYVNNRRAVGFYKIK